MPLDLLPPDLRSRLTATTLEAARAEAEAAGDDTLLLALRRLETLGRAPDLPGLRWGRTLAVDAVSVTREGWREGRPVAVRSLRPELASDPVWVRRLERPRPALPGVCTLRYEASPLPHQLAELGGPSLADWLPADEVPETLVLARFLGGGLRALAALHAEGRTHGGLVPDHLRLTEHGVRLLWTDPVEASPATPSDDLAALGRAVALLDPGHVDEVGALAHAFAEDPPLSAALGQELLLRTLGTALAERRHRLVMRDRLARKEGGQERLLRAARGLERAVPPPVVTACLRAGRDAVRVMVHSDGERVRGGSCAGWPTFLPVLWDAEHGLDPGATRKVLRAWATRAAGDEDRRAAINGELDADDAAADALCRWLSGQARLRTQCRLLELRARGAA